MNYNLTETKKGFLVSNFTGFRYDICVKCWNKDEEMRPEFKNIIDELQSILNKLN